MNPVTVLFLTIAAPVAAGVAAWAWCGLANVFDELRSIDDLEGKHFER